MRVQVEGLKTVTTQLLQAALPARVADGTSAAIADGRWPVDAALALHQQVGHHAMAPIVTCFSASHMHNGAGHHGRLPASL